MIVASSLKLDICPLWHSSSKLSCFLATA